MTYRELCESDEVGPRTSDRTSQFRPTRQTVRSARALTGSYVLRTAAKPGTQPFFKCAEVAGNTIPQLHSHFKESCQDKK